MLLLQCAQGGRLLLEEQGDRLEGVTLRYRLLHQPSQIIHCHAYRQTGRLTDRLTDRQTDTQTDWRA